MNNEYYGASTTSNEDFLAHYGVKGMKWGVRKAVASGNAKRLGRQFRKAEKKLAKLEKRAASGKKYAKRAATLGVGAAAAGGLAVAGTEGVARGLSVGGQAASRGVGAVGKAMQKVGANSKSKVGKVIGTAGEAIYGGSRSVGAALSRAGGAVDKWGKQRIAVSNGVRQGIMRVGHETNKVLKSREFASDIMKANKKLTDSGISKNMLARAGAGLAGAGLAAGAGYNAYRAATTKRAAKKAAQFKSEMNKAFAGTQYAGKAGTTGGKKPRKKRR